MAQRRRGRDLEVADSGVCLMVGGRSAGKVKTTTAPTRVCLTENQQRELFGGGVVPELIGCGNFACVFASPREGRVVKLTSDLADIAGLVAMQQTHVVPKVHRFFELKQGGVHTKTKKRVAIYVAEVDRVRPMTYTRTNDRVMDSVWSYLDKRRYPERIDPAAGLDYIRGLKLAEDCDVECQRAVFDTFRAVQTLRDEGVDWFDVSVYNVGWDLVTDELKILDIGLSNVLPRKPFDVLAGVSTRRRPARLSRRRGRVVH